MPRMEPHDVVSFASPAELWAWPEAGTARRADEAP